VSKSQAAVDADTLNVGFNSTNAKFTAILGAGADALTYTGGALASATLDGGADFDTLTNKSLLPAVRTIKNFEVEII